MNVFKMIAGPGSVVCFLAVFATPALTSADEPAAMPDGAPAWLVKGCDKYLAEQGTQAFCGTGLTDATPDKGFCGDDAKTRARADVNKKIGKAIFAAVDKSKCWSEDVSPSVAVIGVPDSAIEVAAEWSSADNRCAVMETVNLAGFQKSVYKSCGRPDGKDKEIYQVAKEVWDAHFARK